MGVRPIAAVITLSLLVLPVYFWNLNDLGLFNTQESIRVSVAREMQRAGEWIVPLRRGEVYIAKPPMVYWCQIGLANLRGTAVGEFELRLNAALWGWLGVIATYFAARNMLGSRIGVTKPRLRIPAPGGSTPPSGVPLRSPSACCIHSPRGWVNSMSCWWPPSHLPSRG